MALFLCNECLESRRSGVGDTGLEDGVPEAGARSSNRWVRSLRVALGSLIGGVIGALSGNPVAIVASAALGTLASGLDSTPGPANRDPSAPSGTCALCGAPGELEACGNCGRAVCASCRQLVVNQEERSGRTVYRHYVRADPADQDASLSLMPSLAGDEPTAGSVQTAYRLGDQLYVLDELAGELIPLDEAPADESNETAGGAEIGAGWSEDASDGWTGGSHWSAADWESGDWESADWPGSSDETGGGA